MGGTKTLFLLLHCAAANIAAPRPNIIWVMADDLGVGEVGLFPASSPHGRIATPHLDQFGREGTVFLKAYAGYTVCAPSRTTFFTGRHSGSFKKHSLSGASIAVSENVTTIAQVLQRAGYATGAFGKVAPLLSPLEQGFDAFLGQIDQALCHNMYPRAIDVGFSQLNFNLTGNWRPKSRELCMAEPHAFNFTIDVFHAAAMQWLEKVAHGQKPFFMYLSFTIPHAGGWGDAPDTPEDGAPVPSDLQYADKPWPDVEKDHAAAITWLDSKVGDLMDRLKALGIDSDTLVLFASDNGAHVEGGHDITFFNSTGGLLGHKRSLFEGGTRSPSMARWPGRVPVRSSDYAWAFWDVLPTFAELAGTDAPEGLDGQSLVPMLMGREQAPPEYLFWTWPGPGRKGAPSGYGVRVGDWKGVVPHCTAALEPSLDDKLQLYDLKRDPFETTDVAAQHQNVVRQLKELVMSKGISCHCYQCPTSLPLAEIVV